MASLDPRTETIRSVLVRLRTRSGLNVDRLRQTEVDIQPILDLTVVRQYINSANLDPIDAVVHWVRQRAAELAPTDLVIVDAALALGLLRDIIPNQDSADRLYAEDLGDRRAQVVELWSELHELLDAREIPAAPSIRTLRATLEPRALGRLAQRCVEPARAHSDKQGDTQGHEEATAKGRHPAPERALVTIVGGAVMDHIYVVDHIPNTGTSVQATSYVEHPGGKGLNQAVAGSRLGLNVNLIATIGDDAASVTIAEYLRREGVGTDLVMRAPSASSPNSCVLVTRTGSSAAIGWKELSIGPTTADLENPGIRTAIYAAAAVVLTFEPPRETVRDLFEMMKTREPGTLFIVHPSPRVQDPQVLYEHFDSVDYLIGTPWELRELLPESTTEGGVEQVIRQLRLLGVRGVCVIENFGCILRSAELSTDITRFPTALKDAPGSRDAFVAALTYRMVKADGKLTKDDLLWATASMATAQSVEGISTAMPSVDEVNRAYNLTTEELNQ